MSKVMKYLILLLLLVICIYIYFNYINKDKDVYKKEKEVTQEEIEKSIEESLSELEIYYAENEGDIEALDEIVYHHYLLGNTEKAYDLGLKLIEMEPDNPDYYHAIAKVKMKTKEWDEMIDYREKAHSLANTSHSIYFLSTSYLVKDASHSLKLIKGVDEYEMETEAEFLLRYRDSLEEYVNDKNPETLENLIEFIPDNILIEEIINGAITSSDSDEEIFKLELLKGKINEY